MGVRWRRISATLPAVVGWMTEGAETHVTCVRGLPPGTVAVGSVAEDLTRAALVVEHESFDEVKGPILSFDQIPEHPSPQFRTATQTQQAQDARPLAALAALLNDLSLDGVTSPEDARAAVRALVGSLREEVTTATRALLPLHDRIAELEAARKG